MEIIRPYAGLTIYQGDVLEALRRMPAGKVQCVVTSDPYWGLRDYVLPPTAWPEVTYQPMAGLPPITVPAWCGCYGLEPTPEMYVGHSVLIRRALWRVLRDDGVQWLNLGDSWNGSGGAGGDYGPGGLKEGQPKYPGRRVGDLKAKDLCGIPWRVALALQADGWYLRSDIIWHKPNPMPESVTDRPAKAHEYVFLLAKNQSYFYDADAIKEKHEAATLERARYGKSYTPVGHTTPNDDKRWRVKERKLNPGGRNKRSVWTIATRAFVGAHFATFPPELPKICILAGTSPQACPHCSAPWERVTEKVPVDNPASHHGSSFTKGKTAALKPNVGQRQRHETADTGDRRPTCSCEANDGSGKCIVLDPFLGSGTVAQVALEMSREAWGIELNPNYVDMALRTRLQNIQPRFAD